MRALIDSLEPELQAAVVAGFERAAKRVENGRGIARVRSLVRSGHPDRAMGLLADLVGREVNTATRKRLNRSVDKTSALVMAEAAEQSGRGYDAPYLRRRMRTWARRRSGELITGLTGSQREAFQRLYARRLAQARAHSEGRAAPGGPGGRALELRTRVRDVLRLGVGLDRRQAKGMAKAIAQGRATKQLQQRYLRSRAQRIARTEASMVVNGAARETWQRMKLPPAYVRRWILTPDERLCPICGALDGETATVDGKFPGGFTGPPAHQVCRCTQGLIRRGSRQARPQLKEKIGKGETGGKPGGKGKGETTTEGSATARRRERKRLGKPDRGKDEPPPPPRDVVDLSPKEARERIATEYGKHANRRGLDKAGKDLTAATRDLKIARFNEDRARNRPRTTQDELNALAIETGAAGRAYERARNGYLQTRQDIEADTWASLFGDRTPGAGMSANFIGKPNPEWKAAASKSVDDFRRMVPSRMLANIGPVEFQQKTQKGRYGDAGLVFARPDTGREVVGGFGTRDIAWAASQSERRRVRMSKDEPGSTHFQMTEPLPGGGRGGLFYSPKFNGSTTTVHEFGHHLEDAHRGNGMLKSARAFIRERGGPKGFKIRDYAGTDYGDATELVSVGVEQLYGRPEEFARRDPEYFDWIWRWVVRGETD